MEMRLILLRLLCEYDLVLQPESRNWSEGIKIRAFFEKPPLMAKFVPVSVGDMLRGRILV